MPSEALGRFRFFFENVFSQCLLIILDVLKVLDVFGPVQTFSDTFGCIRMHSDAFGRAWTSSEDFSTFPFFFVFV